MAKTASKNAKLKWLVAPLTIANILVLLLAYALGRAYPVPAGVLAVIYFAVVLGVTLNKRNSAKAAGKDLAKLTKDVRSNILWLIILVAILGVNIWLLGGFRPKTIVQRVYQSPSDLASQAVKEAKAATVLPYQIDSITSLTDITSKSSTIQYHYQIKGANTSNLSDNGLRDAIKPNVCTNSDTKKLLDAGVGLQYLYTVYETSQQYQFIVVKADCSQ